VDRLFPNHFCFSPTNSFVFAIYGYSTVNKNRCEDITPRNEYNDVSEHIWCKDSRSYQRSNNFNCVFAGTTGYCKSQFLSLFKDPAGTHLAS